MVEGLGQCLMRAMHHLEEASAKKCEIRKNGLIEDDAYNPAVQIYLADLASLRNNLRDAELQQDLLKMMGEEANCGIDPSLKDHFLQALKGWENINFRADDNNGLVKRHFSQLDSKVRLQSEEFEETMRCTIISLTERTREMNAALNRTVNNLYLQKTNEYSHIGENNVIGVAERNFGLERFIGAVEDSSAASSSSATVSTVSASAAVNASSNIMDQTHHALAKHADNKADVHMLVPIEVTKTLLVEENPESIPENASTSNFSGSAQNPDRQATCEEISKDAASSSVETLERFEPTISSPTFNRAPANQSEVSVSPQVQHNETGQLAAASPSDVIGPSLSSNSQKVKEPNAHQRKPTKRARCTEPSHGGEKEERACKTCSLLHLEVTMGSTGWRNGLSSDDMVKQGYETLHAFAATFTENNQNTYWCPFCLVDHMIQHNADMRGLFALARNATAATPHAAAQRLAAALRRAQCLRAMTKCKKHKSLHNEGKCACEAEGGGERKKWRDCTVCFGRHPYAGLEARKRSLREGGPRDA